MTLRCEDRVYLISLLRRLERERFRAGHAVILDNLHRFAGFRPVLAATLGSYLVRQVGSGHRKTHCWWAFRSLQRVGVVNERASAAAVVARKHPDRRMRQAARAYLDFAAVSKATAWQGRQSGGHAAE